MPERFDSAVRWFGVGLLFTGLWVGVEIDNARLAGRIDLEDRCGPRETGRCFTDELGKVVSVSDDEVQLEYRDGTMTTTVTLAADSAPKPGERVRIEHWNDDIVSLYVPKRERRYRTWDWPRRWDPYLIWLGVVGGLCLVRGGISAYAATSNGKP